MVKALDNLYHPGCFVCFNCSASLSGSSVSLCLLVVRCLEPEALCSHASGCDAAESFFEHDGQAVCAKCKHSAITYEDPSITYVRDAFASLYALLRL